jgi:hypothetical protein
MPKRSSIGDLTQIVEPFAGISRNSRSDEFENCVAVVRQNSMTANFILVTC